MKMNIVKQVDISTTIDLWRHRNFGYTEVV